jgi:hypothetical protein
MEAIRRPGAVPIGTEGVPVAVACEAPYAPPVATYHRDSESLRFWVPMGAPTADQSLMGASVSRSVLHHRFQGAEDGSDALAIYTSHRQALEAAVRHRVALGSREPVIVRENDLPPPERR